MIVQMNATNKALDKPLNDRKSNIQFVISYELYFSLKFFLYLVLYTFLYRLCVCTTELYYSACASPCIDTETTLESETFCIHTCQHFHPVQLKDIKINEPLAQRIRKANSTSCSKHTLNTELPACYTLHLFAYAIFWMFLSYTCMYKTKDHVCLCTCMLCICMYIHVALHNTEWSQSLWWVC